MSREAARFIGRRLRRFEDARLVTGAGRYAGDVRLPAMTHLAVLRSPMPHARIRSLDLAAARSLPGVLAVWAAGDLPELGARMPDTVPGLLSRPRTVLAADTVRCA